jgi:sarcosine oxidase, subunit delta
MKILNCPLNGPRNISEFACLGEVKTAPAPDAGAAEWADFVFFEQNPAGRTREWWIHLATNYLFIVDRDTRSDQILATYSLDDPRLTQTAPGGKRS